MRVAGNVSLSNLSNVWLVGLAAGAVAGACTYKNTQHCQFGGTVCGADEYCDICRDDFKGCFPLSDDPDPACVFQPGMGTETGPTSGPETETGPGTETSTGPGTSMGSSTTQGGGCMGDGACGGATPYCEGGVCVGCVEAGGDGYCAGKGGVGEVCDEGSGACVECLPGKSEACEGATPVCDEETKTCRGCEGSEECGMGVACAWESGRCLSSGVVYVDGGNGGCSDQNAGTEGEPLCTVGAGVQKVSSGGTVVVKGGGPDYQEDVVVGGGKEVGMLGVGGPVLQGNVAEGLRVTTGATVYVEGVTFSGGGSDGVSCNGATLHVRGVVVKLNAGRGVVASGCEVTVRQTEVSSNSGGGVDASDSMLLLENTFITQNGNGGTSPGIRATGGTLDVRYVTVAGNIASGADSLQCMGGFTGDVRNSLLFGLSTDSVNCAGAAFAGNASDTDLGGGNVNEGPIQQSWFTDFNAGDFHLAPGHPFGGVATWKDGDPLVDYDGDARPGMDGAADVAGADVPQ